MRGAPLLRAERRLVARDAVGSDVRAARAAAVGNAAPRRTAGGLLTALRMPAALSTAVGGAPLSRPGERRFIAALLRAPLATAVRDAELCAALLQPIAS